MIVIFLTRHRTNELKHLHQTNHETKMIISNITKHSQNYCCPLAIIITSNCCHPLLRSNSSNLTSVFWHATKNRLTLAEMFSRVFEIFRAVILLFLTHCSRYTVRTNSAIVRFQLTAFVSAGPRSDYKWMFLVGGLMCLIKI